tara:strand:- start:30 stop:209 length:180 start_codon:yes stop_codon:yes gene_type:complete
MFVESKNQYSYCYLLYHLLDLDRMIQSKGIMKMANYIVLEFLKMVRLRVYGSIIVKMVF